MIKKANIFIVVILIIYSIKVISQQQNNDSKYTKGSWNNKSELVSVGVGFPVLNPFYLNKPPVAPVDTSIKVTNVNPQPVIHAKIEFAILKKLGLVISVNRSVVNYTETYYFYTATPKTYTVSEKVFNVNLRANYHFLYNKVIDPYIGVGAGLRKINIETENKKIDVNENKTPFGFEATFGVRTLIKSLVGIYLEVGIGRSIIQSGVTLNLGKRY